jgi:acyl carrier protein
MGGELDLGGFMAQESLSSSSTTIQQRVNDILAEQLGVEANVLAPEANLVDDLGADSLDVVELVMALEEEFGVEIPDEEVENIRTIRDVTEYIVRHAAAVA